MEEALVRSASGKSNAIEWWGAIIFMALGAVGLRVINHPTFWNDYFFQDAPVGASHKKVIGTLEHQKGGVRFRPAGSPVWTDLMATTSPIHEGQYIFTDSNGGALVRLEDGLIAEIQESSLIAIFGGKRESTDSKTGLIAPLFQVKRGAAKLKLPPQLKKAILIVDGKVLELNNTEGKDVELKVTRAQPESNQAFEGTNIEVSTGASIELLQEGKTQVIHAGEIAALKLSINPQTRETIASSIIVVNSPTEPLPQTTAVPQPVQPAEPLPIAAQKFVVPQLALNPPKMDKTSNLAEWVIPLKWQRVPGAAAYLLEIVSESGNAVVQQRLIQTHFNWKLTSLESRKFKYRVTAMMTANQSQESEWEKIELNVIPPTITGPVSGVTLNSSDSSRPPLTWNKTQLSTQYEIQLSTSAEFKGTVNSHVSIQNVYMPDDLAEGVWYWHVRAKVVGGVSEWSASRSFTWVKGESDAAPAAE